MAKWNYGSTNGYSDDGPKGHGEHFKHREKLTYIGSEPVQNILDAKKPGLNLPAKAEYCLEKWKTSDIPGVQTLRKHFEDCRVSNKSSVPTQEVCDKALAVLGEESIRVLKIQDFNTTGVRGPVDQRNSPWHSLVIATGDSKKTSAVDEMGALGSFGLGKFASFVCSDLQTVLYSTKADDGNEAFQGVALVPSYQFGESYKETTIGRILYGQESDPLLGEKIPKKFRRTEQGTDLYVLGFMADKDWEDKVLKAVILKFLVAVYQGGLEVKIGKTSLTRSTLLPLVKKFEQKDKKFRVSQYLKAFTSNEEEVFHFRTSYEDEEDALELFLLPGEDSDKRVAMVRKTGMTIEARFYDAPRPYSGVLIANKPNINLYLQRLENPTHDNWSMTRDRGGPGETALRFVHAWVKEKLEEAFGLESKDFENFDDKEFNWFSIDENDSEPGDSTWNGQSDKGEDPQQSDGGPKKGKVSDDTTVTPISPKPEPPRIIDDRILKPGFPPILDGEGPWEHDGDRPFGPSDESGPGRRKQVKLANDYRFIRRKDKGRYALQVTPLKSGTGYISIGKRGDEVNEAAQINEFWRAGASASELSTEMGLGPFTFVKGEKLKLEFALKKDGQCRFEVRAYEA
jgi:hypothetical protein